MTAAWLDRLGGLAFDAGVAAVFLWSAVALAMLACRQPARRLRIARAATFGALALIPIIGLGFTSRIPILETARNLGLLAHPSLPERWRPPLFEPAPTLDPQNLSPPNAPPPSSAWYARARHLFTLAFASGVAVSLAWLALGHALLATLHRGTIEPDPAVLRVYDALPYRRQGRRPRLRVSRRVSSPVLVGPFRPTILIPPGLEHPENTAYLNLGLLHELAHAENLDPTFSLADRLAHAFWFFIPPVWWISSQSRLDQEFLADRRASETYGDPASYAAALLEIAQSHPRSSANPLRAVPAPTPAPSTSGTPLVQRLLMLLRSPFPVEPRPPSPWSFALPGLAALLTLAAASISLRPLPAHPEPVPRSRSFHLTRLEVPPTHAGPSGRSPEFLLPLQLPDAFDLRLDVWADPQILHKHRVVGLSLNLGVPISPQDTGPQPTWHSVRVNRSPQGLTLTIDDQPRLLKPDALDDLTPNLTVEPAPELLGSYRNLSLTWTSQLALPK